MFRGSVIQTKFFTIADRMLKTFIVIMLALSVASALPTGDMLAKTLQVTGGKMSMCISRKTPASTVALLWAKVARGIFAGRRLFVRNTGVITDAAKAGLKAAAAKLCPVAAYKVLEVFAKAKGPAHWDADAKSCAREIVAFDCTTKVNSTFA
jgi:hypothetical protein